MTTLRHVSYARVYVHICSLLVEVDIFYLLGHDIFHCQLGFKLKSLDLYIKVFFIELDPINIIFFSLELRSFKDISREGERE